MHSERLASIFGLTRGRFMFLRARRRVEQVWLGGEMAVPPGYRDGRASLPPGVRITLILTGTVPSFRLRPISRAAFLDRSIL